MYSVSCAACRLAACSWQHAALVLVHGWWATAYPSTVRWAVFIHGLVSFDSLNYLFSNRSCPIHSLHLRWRLESMSKQIYSDSVWSFLSACCVCEDGGDNQCEDVSVYVCFDTMEVGLQRSKNFKMVWYVRFMSRNDISVQKCHVRLAKSVE